MLDPDRGAEALKRCEEIAAKVSSPDGRAALIARGLDPEAELKKMAAHMDTYRAANAECEKVQEELLHAGADVADAQYAAFKALRQAIQVHKQNDPLDPRLEEWEEFLEAWAEEMPKETEE